MENWGGWYEISHEYDIIKGGGFCSSYCWAPVHPLTINHPFCPCVTHVIYFIPVSPHTV